MDKFNSDNYNVLYRRSEITVLELKPLHRVNFRNYPFQNKLEEGTPTYVFLFRDEIIPELYSNPMIEAEGNNLTQLVASAYKEMFYRHFQRGEAWKGRALERELGYVFRSITAQSLYDKCNATHWVLKVGAYRTAGGTVELHTVLGVAPTSSKSPSVTGCRFLLGDTPVNGKQTDTLAIAELTVNSHFIWTQRGHSGHRRPLQQLVISSATPQGTPIPSFGEMILQNADKIRQFTA